MVIGTGRPVNGRGRSMSEKVPQIWIKHTRGAHAADCFFLDRCPDRGYIFPWRTAFWQGWPHISGFEEIQWAFLW
jgi:hypothetical protein